MGQIMGLRTEHWVISEVIRLQKDDLISYDNIIGLSL